MPQGHRVFAQVAKWSARRRAQRIAQDAHAVDRRFALRVLLGSLRTDNGDLIARVCQSAAFLPDPSIERHRQVLDQDQYVSPHCFRANKSVSSSSYPRAVCWIWNSRSTRARPLLPSWVRNDS